MEAGGSLGERTDHGLRCVLMASIRLVKFKTIKPAKLLATAFTTDMRAALKRVGTTAKADFDRTTRTWNNRPTFAKDFSESATEMKVEVYTDSQVYFWVNDGTSQHRIFPRSINGLLYYRGRFKSKTIPRRISSRSGGKYGDYVYRSSVMHPGFAAREFDIVIAEKTQDNLIVKINQALVKATARCRHAYP